MREMLPGSLLITCPIHLHRLRMMIVGDGPEPEYSQDSSKVLGVDGEQFVEVAFSHALAF